MAFAGIRAYKQERINYAELMEARFCEIDDNGLAFLRAFLKQSGDALHETGGGFNSRRRAFCRYVGIFPCFVIRNGFQIVSLCEEGRKRLVNTRLVQREAVKLALNPLVCFCGFSRALEDESL